MQIKKAFPDAKIALTANLQTRAERRSLEVGAPIEQVIKNFQEVDKVANFLIAPDALEIDTSDLTKKQVFDKANDFCNKRI